jgi:hypothetical protein
METQIVAAIAVVMAAVSVVSIGNSMTMAKGDAAMAQVSGILRTGRDAAITQSRTIEVRFLEPRRIQLVRKDLPDGETVISEIGLENGARFYRDPDLPDTPDDFGNDSAISFGDVETVRFLPDSTLADEANVPVNGTVFVGVPGDKNSARAVTVTGGSARAQAYRWTGRDWETR